MNVGISTKLKYIIYNLHVLNNRKKRHLCDLEKSNKYPALVILQKLHS